MATDEQREFLRDVTRYRRNRPFFYVFLRPLELSLLRRGRAAFRRPLLDFGCGDGFFADCLVGRHEIEYGVDTDPSVASAASGVYRRVFVSPDWSALIPAGSVGTVLSNSVLEHVRHPEVALRNIHRVLAPNGRLYATVVLSNWERFLLGGTLLGTPYRSFMRRMQRHRSLLPADEWSRLMASAGFRVIARTFYLAPPDVRRIELFHYLSLPSLLSRMLTGRWDSLPVRRLNRLYGTWQHPVLPARTDADEDRAACCLFIAEKTGWEDMRPTGDGMDRATAKDPHP